MDILYILLSKKGNNHYIKRYYKFIQQHKHQKKQAGVTETHHICPKSDDLFPEYKTFRQHPWNKINLTKRQHFVAHLLLHKAYGGKQTYAFWCMCNKQSPKDTRKRDYKINSRFYEQAKKHVSELYSVLNSRPNPKNSAHRKKKVSCYDAMGNYLIVDKTEFDRREDLKGLNSGQPSIFSTQEFKQKNKGRRKGYKHLLNPTTGEKRFVPPHLAGPLLESGFIEKFIPYDRKQYNKTCDVCGKVCSPSNHKRWHGPNCKLRNSAEIV